MIRALALFYVMVLLVWGNVFAQEDGFGLGVIVGEPTGICGKLWTSGRTAVDGAVAWSFEGESSVHLHADFLYHDFNHVTAERGELMLYYGIGGRVKFEDDSKAGIRFPAGIDYLFPEAPFDFFFEIAPVLDLAPSTKLEFNAALGFRYFFGKSRY